MRHSPVWGLRTSHFIRLCTVYNLYVRCFMNWHSTYVIIVVPSSLRKVGIHKIHILTNNKTTTVYYYASIYTVSRKNLPTFLALCHLNIYKPISMLVTISRNKHLTKLYINCPLRKHVLALTWEIWSDRAIKRCTYIITCTWVIIELLCFQIFSTCNWLFSHSHPSVT